MTLAVVYFAMITLLGNALLSTLHCFAEATLPEGLDDHQGEVSVPTARLVSRKAHVTLVNLRESSLSPEATLYFESSLITAYETTRDAHKDDDNDMPMVDAHILKQEKHQEKVGGGPKKNLRALNYTPPVSKVKYYDYSLYLTWNCRNCMNDAIWKRRRALFDRDHTKFEHNFCETLRSGPYDIFNDVNDCSIRFE